MSPMSVSISIIIPVYNTAKFLPIALDSILSQTFTDWECILVDDGSTDESGRICDEYVAKDKRFKVIHKKNGGASVARNSGLTVSEGEWICFVDSDDTITEDALESLLNKAEEYDADVCVGTFVGECGNSQEITKVLTPEEQRTLIWSCLAFYTDSYVREGFNVDGPCGKLFRGSVIRENNLQFIDGLVRSEDAIFDVYFYYYASKIIMYSHPVYYYRENPNSLCHRFNGGLPRILEWVLTEKTNTVNHLYPSDTYFAESLYVRSFVGLRQILFESRFSSLKIQVQCVRYYLSSEQAHYLLNRLSYSYASQYWGGHLQMVSLFLAKRKLATTLVLWTKCRPFIVKTLDKIHRMYDKPSL